LFFVFLKLKNRDGRVSLDDFEQYVMTNPNLLPMFADVKDRVRIDSVTRGSPTDNNPSTYYVNVNRGTFVTSQ
jgi:hypothetical protein